ncbi:MAG: hypothetical protein AAGK74_11310 [Chloroflexota bacterium]
MGFNMGDTSQKYSLDNDGELTWNLPYAETTPDVAPKAKQPHQQRPTVANIILYLILIFAALFVVLFNTPVEYVVFNCRPIDHKPSALPVPPFIDSYSEGVHSFGWAGWDYRYYFESDVASVEDVSDFYESVGGQCTSYNDSQSGCGFAGHYIPIESSDGIMSAWTHYHWDKCPSDRTWD